MNAATTPREQLKKEIIAYLRSVGVADRDLIIKALESIKSAAFNTTEVDADVRRHCEEFFKAHPMADGADFYFKITRNFAPRHYDTIAAFVVRYEEIQCAEYELEAAIEQEIDRQHDPLHDSEYDELGAPDFAVCVYDDRIEVRAYGSGMGDLLPKQGRKYIGCQGDIRWQYPPSALPELERLRRPVVRVSSLAIKGA